MTVNRIVFEHEGGNKTWFSDQSINGTLRSIIIIQPTDIIGIADIKVSSGLIPGRIFLEKKGFQKGFYETVPVCPQEWYGGDLAGDHVKEYVLNETLAVEITSRGRVLVYIYYE